jgi:hypothetical protein
MICEIKVLPDPSTNGQWRWFGSFAFPFRERQLSITGRQRPAHRFEWLAFCGDRPARRNESRRQHQKTA